MDKIVIIGNGVSGVTTARHVRKRDPNAEIVIVGSETKYFFARTALMYVFMGHMKFEHTKPYEDSFWEKNRIELCFAHVNEVDFENKSLHLENGKTIHYDKLVLGVGSKPRKFGWKGEDLPGVQGLYSCQDLMQLEENTAGIKSAVVVGGGLIGVELVEMLRSRNIEVTFLIREPYFMAGLVGSGESEMLMDHMEEHEVNVKVNSSLQEITSDNNGRANGVITENGEHIPCQMVGLTIGVTPNISFLENTSLEMNQGILVDPFLQTNHSDVFAIGDCVEFRTAPPGRRKIEQVWYTGRMMGETVAETLTGTPRKYLPGQWFNSAKFFDIEYQTYGSVSDQLPEGQHEFFWKHSNENKSFRLVFDSSDNRFIGLNVFGMRMRHEVIDRWLNENASADYCMEHLNDAWFDPELYRNDFQEFVTKYNQEFNKDIHLKSKSWSRILERIKV
ncbi:MAG: FAD-dependent oxidoreductase [Crocinitomicaceae bacterium]|nr:FAD-dependent oxidoreductase [Crocinitomicaceae bacterium]|tara:strand:+ start:211 stop:1551 length:1341 start_codon:yes stop_codon:yes gene_type:complete